MGMSKRVIEEQENLENLAHILLKESGYLEPCPGDHVPLAVGDEGNITEAYALANAKISSGKIKLSSDTTRRDLTNAIKRVADETGDECYTCSKHAEE